MLCFYALEKVAPLPSINNNYIHLNLSSDFSPPSVCRLRLEPAEEFRPVSQAENTPFFFFSCFKMLVSFALFIPRPVWTNSG